MKKFLPFLLFFWILYFPAQKISSGKWSDLFSYNNVLVIREDAGKLIAATKNGIFFYTPATGEISKLSKANGLHEVKISAFDYNAETKTGLVGYENGSLDVISPDGITYVVDIPIATGYSGDKKINHISISGNLAVISVGYGVSIFRLDRKEFGDTAFFTNSVGVYEPAREAVIKENMVFAVTPNGLKKHAIDVTFPIYREWTMVSSGDFTQISSGNTTVFSSKNRVFFGNGNSFSALAGSFNDIRDVQVTDQNIIVTDQTKVLIYSLSGSLVKSFDAKEQLNTAIFSQSKIFAGTQVSGILTESGEVLKPDGPYSNTSYKIDLVDDQIVISSGGREGYNEPIYRNLGYYHFNGKEWIYPDFFKTFQGALNVLDAVINPAKKEEIFFVNYTFEAGKKGIYRMVDDVLKNKYITEDAFYKRIGGLTFDDNNQLFASTSEQAGKFGFYHYDAGADQFNLTTVVSGGDTQKPFAEDGILYLFSPYFDIRGGLVIYDYNNTPAVRGDDRFTVIRKENNLPASGVVSAALDKNDDLWIGTRIGLRVLQNPKSAIGEASPQAEPIIIEENGVGEELFRDTQILQIEVDSGNQKWISADGGGVFYLSANGEKTLQHFTRENSPLPTNDVTDIKVDKATGKVYFVTVEGVVVYQGDVVNVNDNFADVLVYPNPVVYSQHKRNVKIRGLAAKTNIRITDTAGNLVHQAVARGGFYEWNLLNHRGARVASGIYFVLMTNEDGTDTATAKIAVVN
ncbi:Por secretion system C-terminal sorting domain-containing protein [Kaistella treverensis]|uniref:Por secretion system C-terminal sorting domain-containing protein n=1 Tax=Kaistella treverensis TaxID=631455 RepID=A0A1I3KT66_9FLAO|nr:T9SS type A sorting domain-containing protein [Kaistella treverensis]SFI75627.1 Por secretion system C-terminal sorting domain-containing protein [Kaistella treverensis]